MNGIFRNISITWKRSPFHRSDQVSQSVQTSLVKAPLPLSGAPSWRGRNCQHRLWMTGRSGASTTTVKARSHGDSGRNISDVGFMARVFYSSNWGSCGERVVRSGRLVCIKLVYSRNAAGKMAKWLLTRTNGELLILICYLITINSTSV